ncbi:hypothetical protein [Desulfovibrio cuneatus]|uniref:hypothetical protein n=1 Tax=Desulfovibrio cuneatus TaxID=159728 RepID=UPI0003FF0DB4|nr:hypothetical protein [Desulfovibrio cuneatus]
MPHMPHPPRFLRCRLLLGAFLAVLSLACLWQGAAPEPSAVQALAGGTLPTMGAEAEAKQRLKPIVDTLALSLGGILANLPQATGAEALFAAADTLTLSQNGHEVYYSIWQGTRLIHSPMNPGEDNLELGQSKDTSGIPLMEELAKGAEFGIFLPFSLLPPDEGGPTHLAYARTIHGSAWHLTAFVPLGLPSLPPDFHHKMRLGFYSLGASFAGLAALVLLSCTHNGWASIGRKKANA